MFEWTGHKHAVDGVLAGPFAAFTLFHWRGAIDADGGDGASGWWRKTACYLGAKDERMETVVVCSSGIMELQSCSFYRMFFCLLSFFSPI